MSHTSDELPSILFDGYTVYKELDAAAAKRTSYENVSDVLDAVARLLVKEKSEALAAQSVSEVKSLRQASLMLYGAAHELAAACMLADKAGNLCPSIDGSLLDNIAKAMVDLEDATKYPQPVSSLKGFSLHLSREEWGAVIDGLILERERSNGRKAANSESNSNMRADMCADLIGKINAASALS